MTGCCSLLSKKINLLGRNEAIPGTAESLDANDGKARVYVGTLPEYNAPRAKLDYARASMTPLGSLEGMKSLNHTFRTPANTRDTVENIANMDIESIVFQSAIACGAGSIIRVTFNGTPDLSAIVRGMFLDVHYATNSTNDGTFMIQAVNDGSDYVDIINRVRTDNADDEAAASPAIGDIQNPLEVQWAFNACNAKVRGISRIGIGAITVASYTRNETITGSLSGATGRIIVPAENGDAYLYFEPLTGKFQVSDVITGGSSGAQATASGGPGVHGHFVRPISGDNCDAEVATINLQNDGFEWESRSAVGNMTFECAANAAMFLDFSFQGARNSIGNETLLSVTRDEEDPPICKTAELLLDTFEPVFSQINFDMGNQVVARENGNAADDTGIETYRVTDRESKITLTLEHELTGVFDFFDKLDNGTKVALQMHVGTVADKTVWYFADYLEFDNLPVGDKDGIRTLDVEATCTGQASSGDDEWEFVFI